MARTLPNDILHIILDKLLDPIDHANFSAVCRDWHLAQKYYIRNQPLLPMLMVPTQLEDGDEVIYSRTERSLYNISTGKICDISGLSVPNKFSFCGSSHGWLATVEEKTVIVLVNPFRNALTIRLPPLDFDGNFGIFKVILTADPISNPDNYIVVAIYSFYRKLAFFKSSQKSWAYIDESLYYFHDVIMYKGLAYAINHYFNDIISFDVNSCSEPWELKRFKLRKPIDRRDKIKPKYLVVSSQGELLQVQRYLDWDDRKSTISFKVFRLQLVQEKGEGIIDKIEVKSLGNDAIFVGQNHSFVVSIDSLPRFHLCRPNSIYYTSELYYHFFDPIDEHHKEVGCFSYKDKTFRPYYKFHPCQEWNKRMPRLLWVTPPLM